MSARWPIAVTIALVLSLAATTLSFVLLPFRWASPRADLFSGALDSLDGSNDFRTAFEEAADEWTRKTGFEIDVEPDAVGACNAAGELLNGAEFFPEDCGGFRLGRRVLAVTETLIAVGERDGEEGEIRAIGITFNSDVDWDLYDGPWRNDVADFHRVALHELGHVAALDHEDTPGTPTIMHSFAGDTISLQQDDIDGVRERYPELDQSEPPESPPGDDAVEEPVDLPPLNSPTDTPPDLPPPACLEEHLRLAGNLCKDVLSCLAAGAKNQGMQQACVTDAAAAFSGSDCANETWANFMVANLMDIDAAIAAGIDSSQKKARKLHAKLLKLAGKQCGKAMHAERRNAKKPDGAKLASKRSKARSRAVAKSAKAIAKNERKGFPYTGPTGKGIADGVDALVDHAAGR